MAVLPIQLRRGKHGLTLDPFSGIPLGHFPLVDRGFHNVQG